MIVGHKTLIRRSTPQNVVDRAPLGQRERERSNFTFEGESKVIVSRKGD